MPEKLVVGTDRIDFHLVRDEREQKAVLQNLGDLSWITRVLEFWFVMEKLFDGSCSDLPRL
jgi:hypothetical protein